MSTPASEPRRRRRRGLQAQRLRSACVRVYEAVTADYAGVRLWLCADERTAFHTSDEHEIMAVLRTRKHGLVLVGYRWVDAETEGRFRARAILRTGRVSNLSVPTDSRPIIAAFVALVDAPEARTDGRVLRTIPEIAEHLRSIKHQSPSETTP